MRNYGKRVQKKSSSTRTSNSAIKKKSEIIERKKANLVNNDEQDSEWKITKAAINEPQQLCAFIELVKICDREEKETKRKNKNKDRGEKG